MNPFAPVAWPTFAPEYAQVVLVSSSTMPQVCLPGVARRKEAAPVWVPVGRSEKKENPNAETLIPAPAPAVEYDRV